MKIELHDLTDLRAHLERAGDLRDTALQGLDLAGVADALSAVDATGAVLLGCRLPAALRDQLEAAGALVFPALPHLPYRPYRSQLYTAAELMNGYTHGRPETLHDTYDQRVYRHYDALRRRGGGPPILDALAQRLHDHAIDDALHELLHPEGTAPARVVAVMGGHGLRRDAPAYREVCVLARTLTRERGALMASGGGPGAMEAAMLGAYLAEQPDDALDAALALLAPAPSYTDERWLDAAFDVRARFPSGASGLSIPTWFYGHEPPNVFASHIAKYFSNSLREDGLLAIATGGVVFAPGSAGTIQEVFQDACQNHYLTFGVASPMVFLGRRFWTDDKPVYPLLERLAADRDYGRLLGLVDRADEVVAFLDAHPPLPPAP